MRRLTLTEVAARHTRVANPHPPGSLKARLWEAARRARDETVKRETREVSRPGRGRPKLGRRSEWSSEEVAALREAEAAAITQAAVAALVGRSVQAVRNKAHRLRRAGVL